MSGVSTDASSERLFLLGGDCPNKASGANACGFCKNKKGHDESRCWQKHPEKKQKWWKTKEGNKTESDSDEEVAGIAVDNEFAFEGWEEDW